MATNKDRLLKRSISSGKWRAKRESRVLNGTVSAMECIPNNTGADGLA